MMQLKGLSIPELKCKCLTLELDDYFNLFGATGILRALHHVETLNIDIFNPVISWNFFSSFYFYSFGSRQENSF